MIQKTINGHTLKIYDSIDDLPISNFQKYNRLLLIDSGVGSNLEDIDLHISKILKYINTDKILAVQELQNMRQALYFVNQNVSPKYLAFAALIYEVDGEKVNDLTDDGLKALLDKINKTPVSWIDSLFAILKKKLETELELYFPIFFESAKEKEVFDKLKERTLLILDGIIDDKEKAEEVNRVDDFLFSLSKPKQFSGSKSIEVEYIKQFENIAILISQKTGLDTKKMTVFEFYTTFEQVKKQTEKETRKFKR